MCRISIKYQQITLYHQWWLRTGQEAHAGHDGFHAAVEPRRVGSYLRTNSSHLSSHTYCKLRSHTVYTALKYSAFCSPRSEVHFSTYYLIKFKTY